MRKREIEVWRKNTLALAVVVAASSEKLKFFAGEPEICRFTLTQHQNFHTRLLLLVFKNCGITTSKKQRERKREKWSIYDTNKPEQGWISQQQATSKGSFVFFSSLSFLWWHSNLIYSFKLEKKNLGKNGIGEFKTKGENEKDLQVLEEEEEEEGTAWWRSHMQQPPFFELLSSALTPPFFCGQVVTSISSQA